jgi:hypothetical protein
MIHRKQCALSQKIHFFGFFHELRKKSEASVLAGKADVHVQGMYVQEKVDFSFF